MTLLMGPRMRVLAGLWLLAEVVLWIAVATWIGLGWTILATLATSALGGWLLGRQGVRALSELRERARTRLPAGRALGDTGLVAVGGLLMLLPGFIGDLIGLLCLLPFTRPLPRALVARGFGARLPGRLRGPVRVRSARVGQMQGRTYPQTDGEVWRPGRVIEGDVASPGKP